MRNIKIIIACSLVGLPILAMPFTTIKQSNITNNCISQFPAANHEYFRYRAINSNECAISGLTEEGSTQEILVIPGDYNGTKITTIDTSAISNNRTLKKIMISPNTKTVGKLAFYNCPNLSYVYIPANTTRFLDYSLDTHTTTDLQIVAPNDYDLETMFGVNPSQQKEAYYKYDMESCVSYLYWTQMPANGLAYIDYHYCYNMYSATQNMTAFTELTSHVAHKITINNIVPTDLNNLWLFFGPTDPVPNNWFQRIIGVMTQVHKDKWNFTRTNYYYSNRIIYSLDKPNGTYINAGLSSIKNTIWEAGHKTSWSICHYDVIVNKNGIVNDCIYEQDARYDGRNHDRPHVKNRLNYDKNVQYYSGKYVGGW